MLYFVQFFSRVVEQKNEKILYLIKQRPRK